MAENPTAMQLDFSTKRWLQRRFKNGVPTRHLQAFPHERTYPTASLRLRAEGTPQASPATVVSLQGKDLDF
jgi:hypothetical protein